MKKILLLAAGDLPLPAVRGGAVETILQNVIDRNETEARLDITVLTIRNKKAAILYPRYRYTHFVPLPDYAVMNRVYWKLVGFSRRCLHREMLAPLQRRAELRFLMATHSRFDYLIEELDPDVFQAVGSRIPGEKKILHLHWGGAPSPARDASFGYLIAISRYICGNWLAATGRGQTNAFVLPNGIRTAHFTKKLDTAQQEELRRHFRIPPDQIVLLYVGRIIPEKGLNELIRAIDLLPRSDLTLLLVGSSHFGNRELTGYEREIAKLVKRSAHPVVQTGFVPNTEIYRLQNIADIAVVPSVWDEPAGLVVLEAQAAGLPVIASDSGGIPEFLCPDGGLLVRRGAKFVQNLAAAIAELADDPRRRAAMGLRGRKWAQQYDAADYYNRLVEILDRIGARDRLESKTDRITQGEQSENR